VEILKKEKKFLSVIPDLTGLIHEANLHPHTSFVNGEAGIRGLREIVLKSREKEIFEFSPIDLAHQYFPPRENDHRRDFRKKFQIKLIYTSNKGAFLPKIEGGVERRFVPFEEFPVDGEVTIFGKHVVIINFSPKLSGVHIEHEGIARTFRSLFKLA